MPHIWPIDKLLGMKIIIPDYQRPYKWTNKNITDLIQDIYKSIEESRKHADFKYRIGTVILYKNKNKVIIYLLSQTDIFCIGFRNS